MSFPPLLKIYVVCFMYIDFGTVPKSLSSQHRNFHQVKSRDSCSRTRLSSAIGPVGNGTIVSSWLTQKSLTIESIPECEYQCQRDAQVEFSWLQSSCSYKNVFRATTETLHSFKRMKRVTYGAQTPGQTLSYFLDLIIGKFKCSPLTLQDLVIYEL